MNNIWTEGGAKLRNALMVKLTTYAGMEVGPTRDDYMLAHFLMLMPDDYTDDQYAWLRRAMREAEHLKHVDASAWPLIQLTTAGREYAVSVMTPKERAVYDDTCATAALRNERHEAARGGHGVIVGSAT